MLSKVFHGLILVCVLQMTAIDCYFNNSKVSNETKGIRHKRTLNFYFPYNSCYALAVVMSIPLEDLPAGRSAFCSWNFETNFYYPYFDNANGIIPLPFTWIDEPGANAGTKHRINLPPAYRQFNDDEEGRQVDKVDKLKIIHSVNEVAEHRNGTIHLNKNRIKISPKKPKIIKPNKTKTKTRKVRALLNNYFLSRRRFYKLMESKMDSCFRSGLHGNDCILKAICETSRAGFRLNNGVIGSVVDVLFLPSASKDEKLPKRYYDAESNGKSGNCDFYDKKCPKGIFDFVTRTI